MAEHEKWMKMALELARKGEGRTRPNPPVGAVVVKRGKVLSSGYHKRAGSAHAEAAAISAARCSLKGAAIYVTLEPCSTHGRTAPCVDAIIASGISSVVVSAEDPNPLHRGRGLRILKRKGIEVVKNVLKSAGEDLIAPFSRLICDGRPYVTLKSGMSIDGRIADRTSRSKWITSDRARKEVQKLRKRVDAVMVGCNTAVKDDPSLLCRLKKSNTLYRVVVDSSGRLPLKAGMLNDDFSDSVIIATTRRCSVRRIESYRKKGAEVLVLPESRNGVSLPALMRRLGRMGIMHVLSEGGGELNAQLIKSGLVDEYCLFVAPLIIGAGGSLPAIGGDGWLLKSAPRLEIIDVSRVGPDLMVRAKPSPAK